MDEKIKKRLKRGINRVTGLFDRPPSGSQPSTSSTQLAFTPPTSVTHLQPTPYHLNQSSAPPAPPATTLSNLQLDGGNKNPPAAPILPAPSATGSSAKHRAGALDQSSATTLSNLQPGDGSQHHPAAVIPPAQSAAEQNAKRRGWAELKTFASLLSKGSALFGPLKQAVDGVLTCVETFESVAKNREDYERLRTELNALFQDFPGYFGESTPPEIKTSIADLAQGIERELGLIREKQHERGLGSYVKADQDAEDVLACYRRIQRLFERFMASTIEARLEKLPNSPDAMYRSAKSSDLRSGCTPETRVQVLEQLCDWAYDSESKKIYWMNGMAGTGKTTIAYSLCERLESTRQLAAGFFCSRQLPECRDVNRIIPTISYQLARFSRPFRHAISRVLEENPDVHNQLLPDQFRKLILEPLNQIKDTLPIDLTVVIDALDECDDDNGVDKILNILLSSAQDLPVKFFVTSRPEAKILDRMGDKQGGRLPAELRLHELARSSVQGDIRTYLASELESSPVAISAGDLGTLVERSGVLFIYAATVVRYVGNDNFARGPKRLAEVLRVSGSSLSGGDKGIDALYAAILEAAFDDPGLSESDRDEMKLILDTIICAQEPLSVDVIAGLLGLDDGMSVQAALRPLRSVLHVSDTTHIVTTLHESFPDYLFNKRRSNRFHCDMKEQNARLAQLCFDHINIPNPPFNICNLESSYVFDKDVPDLDIRVKKAISMELSYACRYWDAHLKSAQESQDLAGMLSRFLSNRLLLWMEVMNLKMWIYDGASMFRQMQEWSQKANWLDEDTKELLRDAWMFTTSFSSSPAALSTPHIYVSTLSFWPSNRPITKYYPQRQPHLISRASTAMRARGAIPLVVINAGGGIVSLAYSPDGAYIVSGSFDNTIRIWDAHTGQSVGEPLQGHTSLVNSVAYSPDGAYIVSGSHDNTIRIWNAHTGQAVGQPLQGHTNWVNSVAYSPDGAYIVSGSSDNTIRIWDAHTGQSIGQPLQGHTRLINWVAYSPDGAYIVSCSFDDTIRIWDAHSGQSIGQPLQGHTGFVNSVAYSPDGAYIVSGSRDNTIRIWDAHTGQSVGQPLQGHANWVYSVAYSPDGAYILSGSRDNTIRIWDAHTGRSVGQPLQGHTNWVYSAAFSPDCKHIISGSVDSTIRIWDAHTGQSVGQSHQGHTSMIHSVAYSPDGAYIASGSSDNTLRIWDAHTGRSVGQPFRGHTSAVYSVAYSPGGAYIVSGSDDNTVRIWDVRTGQSVGQPFQGHTRWVNSVAYSPDSAYIVSSSHDNTIRIWDAHTGQSVGQPLQDHTSSVNSVAYSPDGAYIMSGSYDDTIRIWDAHTGQSVGQPLQGHASWVYSVAYSPDSAYIASGSRDNTVLIWDAHTGQTVGQPLQGHTSWVYSVAYSPDGAYIVSGSDDKTIRIWDAHTGQSVGQPLRGHTSWVSSVAYSPNGAYIVSGSHDKTIRIWSVQPGGTMSNIPESGNSSPRTTVPSNFIPNARHAGPHICNLGCRIDRYDTIWTLNSDGWVVVHESKLLVWVPPDLRHTLLSPRCTVIISTYGLLQLGFDRCKIGDHWQEHFQPETAT
ncbi:hypothetical protein FRC10_001216 [Ceratobasidium sp. 414]|nr:hypothetical protein FRC10_001216 [Ceratobasidium sp. 414]